MSLLSPVVSSSGPERTSKRTKGKKRDNLPRFAKKRRCEIELEEGWDSTLVRFRAKFYEAVLNEEGEPSRGLLPEMALAAKTAKIAKDDLKRSVSGIFYCVRARHFANFAILATAAPEYYSWRRKTPEGC